LFIEAEKMLYPFAVASKWLCAIATFNRAVKLGVCAVQFRRHGVGIVKVCQGAYAARRQMRGTNIKDGLSLFLHTLALFW
jgi:hypothetical protein